MPARPVSDEKKAKVVKLYLEENLTQRVISERLGVSVRTVVDALRAAGVKADKSRRMP